MWGFLSKKRCNLEGERRKLLTLISAGTSRTGRRSWGWANWRSHWSWPSRPNWSDVRDSVNERTHQSVNKWVNLATESRQFRKVKSFLNLIKIQSLRRSVFGLGRGVSERDP